ncbi:MAG: helix-turn-helix domain-containing protein [Thermoanaerobaculia bacterium]
MATSERRAGRDERVRGELFPDDDSNVFSTASRGFVPLPIDYRALLRHLTAAQTRVLLYLMLRASKLGLCFPTVDEIAHDIGVAASKHVRPILAELERKGFIRSAKKAGRTYYLILDPSVPIRTLLGQKEISPEELRDINTLREDIGHDPIEEDIE